MSGNSFIRQLYHVGSQVGRKSYSTAIIIPPEILTTVGLKAGDHVEVKVIGKHLIALVPIITIPLPESVEKQVEV